ncbi:hypothetical protein WOLCODRAFT_165315 [Wolfiporia cocos MD-104 SS10]|uniref:BTB domain-containing protein n=1 Tax=Wolfiporia cocos (strain MD-104) TaxID=742152 RepID=A0A2H3JT04_WOLCO|nr:hypothetical protein WOLCODRAFT_165315 [Wolfiporia cocos MD-104 SS10]
MLSERPLKRQRLCSDSADQLESNLDGELERDNDLWYEDGNVILVAQGVGLRVYRGHLAQRSEVFRDLFTFAKPEQREMFCDCPVIRLDDTCQDIRCFLSALLHGSRLLRPIASADISFAFLASVVRMGNKYHAFDLENHALARLKAFFTDSFSDSELLLDPEDNVHFSMDLTDAIAAVNLARLTNASSMLPVALLMCCGLDAAYILSGVLREDGTLECLSLEDKLRCVEARAILRAEAIVSIDTIFDLLPVHGHTKAVRAMRKTLMENAQYHTNGAELLCSRIPWIRKQSSLQGLEQAVCASCRVTLELKDLKVRKEVWDALPSYFGLDSKTFEEVETE